MRRLVIRKPKTVSIEEVEIPSPGSGEILLKVAYCGICGSDLHAFKGEHPFISLPATTGHEFSAKIEVLGNNIGNFEKDQRVTVEPSLVDNTCYNCKIGRYNICENLRVMGCQGDGAMADYIVVPAEKVIPIPKNLTLRDATLSEPLAVGIHAVKRADILLNKNVLIIGAGMIGLSILVNTIKTGAKNIIVIDPISERLDLAKELGATKLLKANEINIKEKIKEIAPYEGIDVVFECVGIERTIKDAIEIVRKGGKIIVVGVFGEETKLKMAYVQDRELELLGSLMYIRRDFTKAVEMLTRNEIPTEKFISRIFQLEEGQNAFEAAFDKEKNIKIIFEINPE